MSSVPFGRVEDQHLELLSAAAASDPARIARGVVAMLNAQPGEVWVGLGTETGRAVRIEAVPDASRGARRILDYLREVIEPRPTRDEVEVEAVETEGGEVLRIAVARGGHGPYAFAEREAREFLVRAGGLVRSLSRDELAAAFGSKATGGGPGPAERLRSRREAARRRREPALWVRFEPGAELDLDFRDPTLDDLLAEPEKSGNRRDGWHVIDPYRGPRLHADRIEAGDDQGVDARVERGGGVELRVALDRLRWKGAERELWPATLAEYPVSMSRLAERIWGAFGLADVPVLADLALIEARGMRLHPYPIGDPRGPSALKAWVESEDMLWTRPLEATFAELRANPDRLGIRLVLRVYESFGFRRAARLPHLRDERLVFPGR